MRKFLAMLSVCFMSTCSAPLPAQSYTEIHNSDGSMTIQVPAESVKACREQGDCFLVSKQWIVELATAIEAATKKQCGVRVEVR